MPIAAKRIQVSAPFWGFLFEFGLFFRLKVVNLGQNQNMEILKIDHIGLIIAELNAAVSATFKNAKTNELVRTLAAALPNLEVLLGLVSKLWYAPSKRSASLLLVPIGSWEQNTSSLTLILHSILAEQNTESELKLEVLYTPRANSDGQLSMPIQKAVISKSGQSIEPLIQLLNEVRLVSTETYKADIEAVRAVLKKWLE